MGAVSAIEAPSGAARGRRRKSKAYKYIYVRVDDAMHALVDRLARAYNASPTEQARTIFSWGLDTLDPQGQPDPWRAAFDASNENRQHAIDRAAAYLRSKCPDASDEAILSEAVQVANAELRLRVGLTELEI